MSQLGLELWNASGQGDHELVHKILNENGSQVTALVHYQNEEKNDETPLSIASENGQVEAMKLLIQNGAPVDAKNKIGHTPLALASYGGHFEAMKLLIDMGAQVNGKDSSGDTPLALASYSGHVEAMMLLMDMGAQVDTKDNFGTTPLAAASYKGHVEAMKLLIERGAQVNSKDNYGLPPLALAKMVVGEAEAAQILLLHGAQSGSMVIDVARFWVKVGLESVSGVLLYDAKVTL